MNCPVVKDIEAVNQTTKELIRSLRNLRRSMRNCQECEHDGTCQPLVDFNSAFLTALQQIQDEWSLI